MPLTIDLPVRISRYQEPTRNANNDNWTPWHNVSNHSMEGRMPNDTTTAVQHRPKAHLGLPTTSWLRPSSFDKHSCSYVGQWSTPTHAGHFHHDLRSTTFTDREQLLCSEAASSLMHLHANHAHHASPLQLRMQLAETQTTVEQSPVKRKHQPRTCSVHTASAMNRQRWLRQQELPAPCAKIPSPKKQL